MPDSDNRRQTMGARTGATTPGRNTRAGEERQSFVGGLKCCVSEPFALFLFTVYRCKCSCVFRFHWMVHVRCVLLSHGSFPAELKVQFTFDGSSTESMSVCVWHLVLLFCLAQFTLFIYVCIHAETLLPYLLFFLTSWK